MSYNLLPYSTVHLTDRLAGGAESEEDDDESEPDEDEVETGAASSSAVAETVKKTVEFVYMDKSYAIPGNNAVMTLAKFLKSKTSDSAASIVIKLPDDASSKKDVHQFSVKVTTATGKSVIIQVLSNMKIYQVLQLVKEKLSIIDSKTTTWFLMRQGVELAISKTVRTCGIVDNDELVLQSKTKVAATRSKGKKSASVVEV